MSYALKILGSIYLIISFILAILIIYNYGEIEVGIYYKYTETNVVAIGCSLGIVFQGVLVFCITLGLAKLIETNKAILDRLNISKISKKEPTLPTKKRYKKCSVCGELNDEDVNFCGKCDHYLKDSEVYNES